MRAKVDRWSVVGLSLPCWLVLHLARNEAMRPCRQENPGRLRYYLLQLHLLVDAPILNLITSERLSLRWLTADDAPFILELLTNPSWLQYIGDKGLKTTEDARNYIVNGPMAMYEKYGFGLYLVERVADGAALGLCGLIKRDGLADVDIGYGFMPRYWSQGYALESSLAVLDYGRKALGIERVVAITSDDNQASVRLLEKLGLRHTANVRLSDIAPELMLFTPQDAICI